jgi:hypothetical protein
MVLTVDEKIVVTARFTKLPTAAGVSRAAGSHRRALLTYAEVRLNMCAVSRR